MANINSLSYRARTLPADSRSSEGIPPFWLFGGPLIVGLAYYLGARLGFAVTLPSSPISTLWPPNSILLAALLLAPRRWWWWILLGALPAHLAVELPSGFPAALVLGWYISNCSEALLGAFVVGQLLKEPLRFDRSQHVGIFLVGSFLAVLLSGFLDAGFVKLFHASSDGYWDLWQSRLLSNVLTSLTVVPAVITWAREGVSDLRRAAPECYLEAGLLSLGLLIVATLVFNDERVGAASPALLYAPLPFVLWAAVRFGSRGTSISLLIVAGCAIWGAVHGHGPFLTRSPAENAVSIQLFLIVFAIPLLVLAAVIQERRQAEAMVRLDQDRLSLAMEAAHIGTWEWNVGLNTTSLSVRSQEILGLPTTGTSSTFREFLDVISPEDRGRVDRAIRDAVEKRESYECEFRVIRSGDEERWVLGKGKALYDNSGHPTGLVGVNVDITDRKTADTMRQEEVLLRESEAKLRELANAMPQIVWTATPDGRFDYFNRRWYELTGASPTTIAEQSWLNMTHPADREQTLAALRQSLQTGEPCEVEHRLKMVETGEYRWYLARARPVRDASGAIIRWYGSCTDIHDRKRVEEALREVQHRLEERVEERTSDLVSAVAALETEISDRVAAERALRSSEQRFSKAFQASPDAIILVRQSDYRFLEVNQKWEAIFGYSRDEAIGRTADELGLVVNEEERQCARALLKENGYVREFEMNMRTKAGEIRQLVLVGESVEMSGQPCYITIFRDITERKRSDSMLLEQQRELAHLGRVASLGELSGTLAHELNQPLAAILTNVNAARRMLAVEQPDLVELRAILEDIAADDRRAGDVIGRLRGMLKKGDLLLRPIDLRDVIGEVRELLHSDLIQRRVSVGVELEAYLPFVLGDRIQLEQVLLNLMLNACDAMAGRPPEEREIVLSARAANGAVLLSVKDQGTGIPEPRLDEVFQPFVTTKDHGLGLGLAICRSIVSAHGGWMWAVNNEGAGVTFVVQLEPAQVQEVGRGTGAMSQEELVDPELSSTGTG